MPTFEEFLAGQTIHISTADLVINLLIAAALSFVLAQVYVRYGNSLSNRRMFAKDFLLVTMGCPHF